MNQPPDKARRRQLRDAYKRAETQARIAALPLDRAQLTALVESVDELVLSDGCDHTLRHTEAWVRGRGLDRDVAVAGLAELGGYCDCEVVLNCDPEDVFG